MRFLFTISFPLLFLVSSCNFGNKNLKVVSFNLRYANNSDGANSWENRKPLVKNYLKKGEFDIISFQEVLKPQLDFLTGILNDYTVITAGRDDGLNGGEHCSIFFKSSKFELLAKSHFWLSEKPEEAGSIGWGAHLPRIVTWVKLQNKRTGHIFFVYNTHLSHVSEYARNKSVLLLLNKIKSISDNVPVIVTGDFNSEPNSQAHMLMTGNWHKHFSFSDTHKISTFPATGVDFTYNGFKNKNGIKRIDYIFVNGYLDVLNYKTSKIVKDSTFISDHFPIVAEVKFNIDRLERNGENKPIPKFAPAPVFETSQLVFEDSIIVPVRSDLLNTTIFYTLNGKTPDSTSNKYLSPLIFNKTTKLTATTIAPGFLSSPPAQRVFLKGKLNNARLISIKPYPNRNFSRTHCRWLFDGRIMQEQIQNTECVNIIGKDIEVVFKLNSIQEIKEVYVSIIEDHNICVFAPKEIGVSVSKDGNTFRNLKLMKNNNPFAFNEGRKHTLHRIKISGKVLYVKIRLVNPGTCPDDYSPNIEPSRMIIDEAGVL
jgi:endonuclease/exonuclease/phosphatase family metal-dependent hydrolase